MKTKLHVFLALFVALFVQLSFAQQRTVTGTVSDDKGMPISGANVVVKGAKSGVQTDLDGKFSIKAESDQTLVITYVGFNKKEVSASSNNLKIKLQSNAVELEGVVVTAQGIKREKKSLGYATQQITGNDLNGGATDGNVANLLSGKAAGVEIRRNNNMGGSTNVVIRGSKSLTGNNQALWVIDGVPIDNSNSNFTSQQQGGSGYDYGNTASDINQEDIESINILKGAAATALYGSRAANGVVLVTTKKGKQKADKGIGVSVSSSLTVGTVDKSTFAKYQDKYGAGYGPYYGDPTGFLDYFDVNGDGIDDLVAPTYEDASYGAPFQGQMVYQWNAFTPYSSNFGKATPWRAAENGPITFFKNSIITNNSVTLESATDKSNLLLSYSNYDEKGILPNSGLKKNQISTRFSQKVTDKLTVNSYASVTLQNTIGRNSTGYNDNIMTNFRQWWQTNVDLKELEDVYFNSGGQNITWNWSDVSSPDGLVPIFWDNPYFTRYKNYSSDNRNRLIGYTAATYDINKWLNATGRVSIDTYKSLQEERRAIGSIASGFGLSPVDEGSGYQRYDQSFKEINYDFMLNFNKKFGSDLSLAGVFGTNIRRKSVDNVLASTIGGLVVPELYALSNSRYELPFPIETKYTHGVNGIYAQASLGIKDTYFIEGSIRRDASSTLPKGENAYYYPAISGSVVLSNLIKSDKLNFAKLRTNYAEVGNDAPPLSLINTFQRNTNFHGQPVYTLPNVNKNPNLKPERTKSFEVGLEASMLNKRLGFDLSYYVNNSVDQIVSGAVSSASGVTNAVVNGGEIQNKGIEVQLTATPLKARDFQWDVTVNWSKNKNTVISLPGGLENLQLGSFQGGITINATPGEPYGTIKGTDYIYHANGQPIVSQTTGRYLSTSTSDKTIGNITPDWVGGIRNKFTYKNISLGFLIDMQKGGDIFSLDMYYGLATGLYPETAEGNIRETGVIHPGVAPDGTPNTVYTIAPDQYGNNYGYRREPNKSFIYDASFVKLREASITYSFSKKFLGESFIKDLKLSLVGTNLWIIHKNLPYADPESGLTSGNLSRGYSVGSLPTTRNIGLNLSFKF
ncbi:TonB-linked SusC/RagA family outer membrane protein [Flavobacterium croceum DSM 17960]|uniref:TonB-linked SusC/RagA family outer membrane protein n=1 Tax=Flavobacterium croceum DSM 17960 TaxID=1121886 RepID=A0A2S4N9Q5_9FLAO|nr:SusC/RagA family TonB-linked outer membrane protein [Flavobacterium croceum]POS02415.1 TonB-linked SusC/RagA family outer membrane protein [Flavobacterium croceum DSM 17960]